MNQPIPAGPDYAGASISSVLPSVAASLGADTPNPLDLPAADRACILMVDGLGTLQLKRYAGHAPYLARAMQQNFTSLSAVYPTTTAASLASFGTGLEPGQHGLVGYDVYDPDRDVVINQLGGWDPRTVAEEWQPHPTVFSKLPEHLEAVTVSMPQFADSSLTRAALAGTRFVPAQALSARFLAARTELAEPGRLVYLYANELDKVGHSHGPGTDQWLNVLEELDGEARRLAKSLPDQALLVATGDHGMVGVEETRRIDYSAQPELINGIAHTAGEPRFVQLHFAPEASPATRQATEDAWRAAYGHQAWVLTRDEAVAAGWFGRVADSVWPRIGDLIIAAYEPIALYDSRWVKPAAFEMAGHHGSPTKAERTVPLLRLHSPQ